MKKIGFFLFLVLFGIRGYGAERIALYPGVGSVRVTNQAQFFADMSGVEDIESVVQKTNEAWRQVPEKGFAKPFDAKPYWIKIPVRCQVSEAYFFQSTYVILEDFALYIHNRKTDSIFYKGNLGLKNSLEKNDILHSSFVFRVPLKANTDYDFYLRLNKRFSTTAIPFFLRDSSNFAKHINQIEKERGIIYGIFFMLLFQGFVLLLYFKEKLHFHYIGYVLTSFLILFISDGTFRLYFPSELFDVIHFTTYFIIPTCFSFVFLVVFGMLKTRTHFPTLVRISWWTIALSFVFSISNAIGYFYLPSYPLIIFRLTTLVILLYPVLFIIICTKSYLKFKNHQALVLLTLFSLTLIFIVLFALLPFLTYKFEQFSQFKWIVLFEGVVLMLIINRDLYLNKIAKAQLIQDLSEQKELVTQRYLDGLLDERRRIASNLHDSLSAKIAAFKIQLSSFKFSEIQQKEKALSDLDDLHLEVRNSSHALSPIFLKEKGIQEMLEEFILKIEDSDLDLIVDYAFELSKNEIPSPHVEILYFTALELINNVLKHAQARNLKIELKESENLYLLLVEDDGIGYGSEELKTEGIGLKSIHQRAEFLNGSFRIEHLEKGSRHVFTIQKKMSRN